MATNPGFASREEETAVQVFAACYSRIVETQAGTLTGPVKVDGQRQVFITPKNEENKTAVLFLSSIKMIEQGGVRISKIAYAGLISGYDLLAFTANLWQDDDGLQVSDEPKPEIVLSDVRQKDFK